MQSGAPKKSENYSPEEEESLKELLSKLTVDQTTGAFTELPDMPEAKLKRLLDYRRTTLQREEQRWQARLGTQTRLMCPPDTQSRDKQEKTDDDSSESESGGSPTKGETGVGPDKDKVAPTSSSSSSSAGDKLTMPELDGGKDAATAPTRDSKRVQVKSELRKADETQVEHFKRIKQVQANLEFMEKQGILESPEEKSMFKMIQVMGLYQGPKAVDPENSRSNREVDKLKIELDAFSGEDDAVDFDDWRFEFEQIANERKWDEDLKRRMLLHKLKGPAKASVYRSGNPLGSYEELVAHVDKRYGKQDKRGHWMSKLMNLTHGNETMKVLSTNEFARYTDRFHQYSTMLEKLGETMGEYTKTGLYCHGLHGKLVFACARKRPQTVKAAEQLCEGWLNALVMEELTNERGAPRDRGYVQTVHQTPAAGPARSGAGPTYTSAPAEVAFSQAVSAGERSRPMSQMPRAAQPLRASPGQGFRTQGAPPEGTCWKCGGAHYRKQCPSRQNQQGVRRTSGTGQMSAGSQGGRGQARPAPKPRDGPPAGIVPVKCRKCLGWGHVARECPARKVDAGTASPAVVAVVDAESTEKAPTPKAGAAQAGAAAVDKQ